jgi:hypothetical protein
LRWQEQGLDCPLRGPTPDIGAFGAAMLLALV